MAQVRCDETMTMGQATQKREKSIFRAHTHTHPHYRDAWDGIRLFGRRLSGRNNSTLLLPWTMWERRISVRQSQKNFVYIFLRWVFYHAIPAQFNRAHNEPSMKRTFFKGEHRRRRRRWWSFIIGLSYLLIFFLLFGSFVRIFYYHFSVFFPLNRTHTVHSAMILYHMHEKRFIFLLSVATVASATSAFTVVECERWRRCTGIRVIPVWILTRIEYCAHQKRIIPNGIREYENDA